MEAKIANEIAVLERYAAKNAAPAEFEARLATMRTAMEACAGAATVASLDGFEGTAARAYFDSAMGFNKSDMQWPGRRQHPATDPLNALLSLGYTLIMHELTGLLEGAGLDPYIGYLHQPDRGRPSLALDLMEPFRHPLADRLTLALVNREMIQAGDFHADSERPGVFLKPQALRKYFGEWERWMLDRSPETGLKGTRWREALKAEVEKLAAALREGTDFAPFRWQPEKESAEGTEAGCNTSSVTI